MKTKKKIEKIKEKVDTTTTETSGTTTNPQSTSTYIAEEKPLKINPFSGDFGRQDINELRNKVNEIIDFLNK